MSFIFHFTADRRSSRIGTC